MSNFLSSNPNIRRGLVSAAALALPIGAAACSPASSPEKATTPCNPVMDIKCANDLGVPGTLPMAEGTIPDTTDPSAIDDASTTSIPKEYPTTINPREAEMEKAENIRKFAEEYIKSPERNEDIDVFVQGMGQTFIEACNTGAAGPCDIYNAHSDQWRSQSETNTVPGWSILQLNSQKDGYDIGFSASVWVDENWSIDTIRGVKGIRVSDPNGTYTYEAPGGDYAQVKTNDVVTTSWTVSNVQYSLVDQPTYEEASEFTVDNVAMVEDLQIIDATNRSLTEHFVSMYL